MHILCNSPETTNFQSRTAVPNQSGKLDVSFIKLFLDNKMQKNRTIGQIRLYLECYLPEMSWSEIFKCYISPLPILINIIFICREFFNHAWGQEKQERLLNADIIVTYVEFWGLFTLIIVVLLSIWKRNYAVMIDSLRLAGEWSVFKLFYACRPDGILEIITDILNNNKFNYLNSQTSEINSVLTQLNDLLNTNKMNETKAAGGHKHDENTKNNDHMHDGDDMNIADDEREASISVSDNKEEEKAMILDKKSPNTAGGLMTTTKQHTDKTCKNITSTSNNTDKEQVAGLISRLQEIKNRKVEKHSKKLLFGPFACNSKAIAPIVCFLILVILLMFGLIVGLIAFVYKLSQFSFITSNTVDGWSVYPDWYNIIGFSNQLWGMVNLQNVELSSILNFIFIDVELRSVSRESRYKIMSMDSVIKMTLIEKHSWFTISRKYRYCFRLNCRGFLIALSNQASIFRQILLHNPFDDTLTNANENNINVDNSNSDVDDIFVNIDDQSHVPIHKDTKKVDDSNSGTDCNPDHDGKCTSDTDESERELLVTRNIGINANAMLSTPENVNFDASVNIDIDSDNDTDVQVSHNYADRNDVSDMKYDHGMHNDENSKEFENINDQDGNSNANNNNASDNHDENEQDKGTMAKIAEKITWCFRCINQTKKTLNFGIEDADHDSQYPSNPIAKAKWILQEGNNEHACIMKAGLVKDVKQTQQSNATIAVKYNFTLVADETTTENKAESNADSNADATQLNPDNSNCASYNYSDLDIEIDQNMLGHPSILFDYCHFHFETLSIYIGLFAFVCVLLCSTLAIIFYVNKLDLSSMNQSHGVTENTHNDVIHGLKICWITTILAFSCCWGNVIQAVLLYFFEPITSNGCLCLLCLIPILISGAATMSFFFLLVYVVICDMTILTADGLFWLLFSDYFSILATIIISNIFVLFVFAFIMSLMIMLICNQFICSCCCIHITVCNCDFG